LSHLFKKQKAITLFLLRLWNWKNKTSVAVAPVELGNEEVAFVDGNDNSEMETLEFQTLVMLQVEEVEEVKVVTKADDAEQKRNQNFE
jgi:DNA polymerase-3 subunit alpha